MHTEDDPIDAPTESRAERRLRLLQELGENVLTPVQAIYGQAPHVRARSRP